jgi:hypothetical protein
VISTALQPRWAQLAYVAAPFCWATVMLASEWLRHATGELSAAMPPQLLSKLFIFALVSLDPNLCVADTNHFLSYANTRNSWGWLSIGKHQFHSQNAKSQQ